MPFKIVFLVAFVIATTLAIRTARRAVRRHGGSLNQMAHEVPGIVAVRAALGLVFYAALFAWSFRTLGTNYRGGVGLHDAHELVTTGPYAVVRHPIHLAFIAIMALVLPLSASWVLGVSGLLLVGGIAAARIPVEERQLGERFGAAWAGYRRRTGCLLPRIGSGPLSDGPA